MTSGAPEPAAKSSLGRPTRVRLSVGAKILSGYLVVITLTSLVALTSLYRLASIDRQQRLVCDRRYPAIRSVLEADVATLSALSRVRNYYITGRADYPRLIDADLTTGSDALRVLDRSLLTAAGRRASARLRADFQTYQTEVHETVHLTEQGNRAAARVNLDGDLQKSITKLRRRFSSAVSHTETETAGDIQEVRRSLDTARAALWLASGLSLLGCIAAGLVLTRLVTDPLNRLVHGMTVVARGDLSHNITIETGDELEMAAEAFAQMSDRLKAAVYEVAAGETADAAKPDDAPE